MPMTMTPVNESINPDTGLPWTDEEWAASGNSGPNPGLLDGTTGSSPDPAPTPTLDETRPVWQDYALMAIHSLYPHVRDGVDFSWGRAAPEDVLSMTFWDDTRLQPPDMAAIQAAAEKMMADDPVNAKPGETMHAHYAPPGTGGEVIPPKSR